MKRTTTIALVAAIALTMTGCDALDAVLGFNMFESLAAVDSKEISEADAETLVELSDSDSFYDALEDDAALKGTTLDKIEAVIGSPSSYTGAGIFTTASSQELAVLAANIELQTTAAGDLINNVSSLVTDLINGTTPDSSHLEETIRGLVPDSVMNADNSINETAFLAMIDSLVSANDYYIELGESISSGAYASGANINAGEIAQNAILAAMVTAVGDQGYASTGAYLYELLEGSASAPGTYDFPALDSGYLGNILTAADMTFNI